MVVTIPALDHLATSAITARGADLLASVVSIISLEEMTPLELQPSAGPTGPGLSVADSVFLSCQKQLPTDPVQEIPPASSNNGSGLWSTNLPIEKMKDRR